MSWRTSGCRTKARRLAENNREYILMSRESHGDCTFCGRHDGENIHGSISRWGKKRAMKRYYATGKTRSLPKRLRSGSWYANMGVLNYPGESDLWWRAPDLETYNYYRKLECERERMSDKTLSDPRCRKFS